MIISGGVAVKSPDIVQTFTPATFNGWQSSAWLGSRWVSYSNLYGRQVWVRTVVDKRALLLARLPLKVYQHDDLNRPEVPEHPYARLLARPNDRQSRFAFWLWIMTTYDIFGEAFAGKVRDRGGRPAQLVPMHPTSMHARDEKDGRVIWDFDNGRVQIKNIPDEDLFHPKNYNPDSLVRGLSKLESLRATLENEDAALRAQSSFWKNGARPGVVLTHPNILSKAAGDRLKLDWESITSGADNYGRTVILEEGMKPEIMSLSAEEAQYIEARRLNREEVIAAYDIPPPAVHVLDRATFSNIVEQMRSVYRDTIAPVTAFLESELEMQVRGSSRRGSDDPDFGDDVYAEFLLDGVLRGDFEDRAEAYQKAINSGWTTPAEVRKLENLPFIEGSDQLFINSTMIPVTTAASAEPDAPAPAPSLDEATVRTVLGRLSRPRTLAEVDRRTLVHGLNGHTKTVLAQVDAAVLGGEGVEGLRERIKCLEGPKDYLAEAVKILATRDPQTPQTNVHIVNEMPEQKAPVVNVAPAEVTIAEGAVKVEVAPPEVNVPPAQVDVHLPAERSRRIERDEDGEIVAIVVETDA